MGRRIRWVGLVLILCFALVILQLVNVQFREASAIAKTPDNPHVTSTRFDNQRGLILAATGKVVARSKKVPHAGTSTYQYYRTYPTGPLFAGVVGYDSLIYGTAGVEYEYNDDLVLHHHSAKTLEQLLSPPAPTTDNVTLTITTTLQKTAAAALAAIPRSFKDGAVVAIDPRTGAVLADYSNPTFNPDTLASPDGKTEQAAFHADRTVPDQEGYTAWPPMATFDRFFPGSTFKVVTSSAVYNLDRSLIDFNYPVQACTSPHAIPTTTRRICNEGTRPTNAIPCGGTMVQMLPPSCDPGYVTLGLHLGATNLYEQASLFGFNAKPPIDLPSTTVSSSFFPTPTSLSPGHSPGPAGVAYAAFGQGTVSETALQNAMVAAGIADTGKVMTPHVMATVDNDQGAEVQAYKPTVYKQATTASAAESVKKLMELVVSTPTGTGYYVGFPPQDDVAAKTGTAQSGIPTEGNADWMIGFAPASNPTVAVAVVVPDQPKLTFGATTAGPILKTMLEAALAQQAAHPMTTPTTTTTTPTTTTTTPTTTTTVPTPSPAPPSTPPPSAPGAATASFDRKARR